MFSVDLSIHCPYIWEGMLYPWVILFPCWPSRSESQPSYPCRHKLTVPEFLLTIPGETKTLLLLSLVLTWLPSGPLWVSQHWHSSLLHGWRGVWDLGFLFKTWSLPCIHTAKCEKSLLCLDFPLVYLDCYWCILTLLHLCFVART